jgi:hypothetical protein
MGPRRDRPPPLVALSGKHTQAWEEVRDAFPNRHGEE